MKQGSCIRAKERFLRNRCFPSPRRSSGRAFTLLEVLVALAILGIALFVMGKVLSQGVNESIMTRRRAQGVLLAQAKMEEVLAHRDDLTGWLSWADKTYPVDPETARRLFLDPKAARYRWTCDISDVADQPGMKEIVVRCYWPRRGVEPWATCEFRTLLLVPRKLFGLDERTAAEGGQL